MNDILLIKKTDFSGKPGIQHITFVIKGMQKDEIQKKVVKAAEQYIQSDGGRFILKYNGFDIDIDRDDVPELIGDLSKDGVKIYGVYELYDK